MPTTTSTATSTTTAQLQQCIADLAKLADFLQDYYGAPALYAVVGRLQKLEPQVAAEHQATCVLRSLVEGDQLRGQGLEFAERALAAAGEAPAPAVRWTVEHRVGFAEPRYELKEGTAHRGRYYTGAAALEAARNMGASNRSVVFVNAVDPRDLQKGR